MNNIRKKFVSILLVASLLAAFPVVSRAEQGMVSMVLEYDDGMRINYNAEPVNLLINGRTITNMSMPPVIIDDYILVPARDVFEMIGAVVDWKPDTREIFIGYGDSLIIMRINDRIAFVDGVYMEMTVPPRIINGKTMIPIRFPSQAFGFLLEWQPFTRTASIFTGDESYFTSNQNGQTSPVVTLSTDINNESVIDLAPKINETVSTDERAKDISPADIPAMSFPNTVITGFRSPNNSNQSFVIEASSAISKVTKTLLPDNRLFLDIYGAENKLDSGYIIEGNPAITTVRTAQNQFKPELITRVVFDLQAAVNYSVTISADRKSIYVNFKRGSVVNAQFVSNLQEDLIWIDFTENPGVNAYIQTNPNKFVIDIPLADMKFNTAINVNGRYAYSMTASQYDENTGRVALDLKEVCAFSVSYEGNRAIIRLSPATYRNIEYDNLNRTIRIRKDAAYPIAVNQITHNDQYNFYKYTLTLPGNYAGYLGSGEYAVRDNYLSSINIQTDNTNRTELVMNERQVLAYNITEDAQFIYIKVMLPKEKYNKIVVLDPGHGGYQPGTIANNIVEKNLTLDITNKLIALIERDNNYKVYATRTTDVFISRPDRADFANIVGDIFVSVHINAEDNKRTSANGTEAYYYPHDNDQAIGFTSYALAVIMQNNLLKELGSNDRKVKEYGYDVLTDTVIPAVLCEIGFLTNPAEAAKLATDSYRQKAAQAIYMGIIETFNRYTPRR